MCLGRAKKSGEGGRGGGGGKDKSLASPLPWLLVVSYSLAVSFSLLAFENERLTAKAHC